MSFYSERLKTGTKKRFIIPDEVFPISTPSFIYEKIVNPPNYQIFYYNCSNPTSDEELIINYPNVLFVGFVKSNPFSGNFNLQNPEGIPLSIKINDINNPIFGIYEGWKIKTKYNQLKLYVSNAPTGNSEFAVFIGFGEDLDFSLSNILAPAYKVSSGANVPRRLKLNSSDELLVNSVITGSPTIKISQTGSDNDVDVLTLPAIKISQSGSDNDVDILTLPSLPTGSNTIGTVIISHGKTLKHTSFSVSSSGINNVVSAVSAKKISVFAYKFICSAAVGVLWASGGSGLEGSQSYGSNSGAAESVNPPAYLFQGGTNEALQLSLTSAVTVAGRVSYWEE